MHRKQSAEFVTPRTAEKGFDLHGIKIKCTGIDIGKHWARAGPRDGASRSKEAERRGENLIPGLHASCDQSQPQGIGAGGATDGVGRAAEIRKLALESFALRPQNVMLRRAHASHGGEHFGAKLLILPLQIQHGHGVERCGARRLRLSRVRL